MARNRVTRNLELSAILGGIDLAVACPMANEAETAVTFVQQVLSYCGDFRSVRFFAILDRASKDNTLDLLQELAAHDPRVCPVWAPENQCVVDAYVRGYREALMSGADWILEIDAGFSHRPEDLPLFFAKMAEGYECVFGTRFAQGGKIERSSWKRELVSRAGTLLARLILPMPLSDMTSGFQMFRREILAKILIKGILSRGPFFQTEMKAYCYRQKFAEVPITYSMASHNVALGSIQEALRQMGRLFRLRSGGALSI